jgi:hypothetical protein
MRLTGLYVMEWPEDADHNTGATYVEPKRRGSPVVCPYCGTWIAGEEWLEPCLAEVDQWGSTYDDVVDGVLAHGFLFSERFKVAYERAGLRGLLPFRPVEVVKVTGPRRKLRPVPQYFWSRAEVDGSRIDPDASGVVWDFDDPMWDENDPEDPEPERTAASAKWAAERREKLCWYSGGGGPYTMDKVVLLEETLTGNDAFLTANLPACTIVSGRFKRMVEDNGFLVPKLTPIEEYRVISDEERFRDWKPPEEG